MTQPGQEWRRSTGFWSGLGAAIWLSFCLPSLTLAQSGEATVRHFMLEIGWGVSDLAGSAHLPVEFSSELGSAPPGGIDADRSPPFPLPYDDDESTARVFLSYGSWKGLSVELGYSDMGEYQPTYGILSCTGVTTCDSVSPLLSVEQWSLGLRYDSQLTSSLFGVWRAAALRAKFEVDALSVPLQEGWGAILFPRTLDSVGAPDDETGWLLGAGIRWQFADRAGLGLNYHRHDIGFATAEMLDLSISVRLMGQD